MPAGLTLANITPSQSARQIIIFTFNLFPARSGRETFLGSAGQCMGTMVSVVRGRAGSSSSSSLSSQFPPRLSGGSCFLDWTLNIPGQHSHCVPTEKQEESDRGTWLDIKVRAGEIEILLLRDRR